MTKRPVKVDTYRVISEAVDVGVAYGVQRAFKHTDTPTMDWIIEQVNAAVMNELSEVILYPKR